MGCAPARRERRCTHFATVGSVPLVVQGDACARRRRRRDLAAADRLRSVHAGKRGPRPRRITQGVRQEATQARARRPWKCSPRAARRAAGAPTAVANRNQTKTKLRTGSTGVRRTSSSWAATRFPRKNGTLAYVPVGGRRDWQRRHGWQSVVEQGACPLDLWWAVEKAEGAAASGTRRRETSRENGGGSAPRSADLLHTANQVRFPQTDRRVAVVPTDQLQLPRRGGHRQMAGGG